MAVRFPVENATFIHVPKTGGTSFYEWIAANVAVYEQQPNNNYAEGCIEGARAQWGDLGTVFSFVRNPYSRLVSMYHFQYKEAQRHLQSGRGTAKEKIEWLRTVSVSQNGFNDWLERMYSKSSHLFGINDASPDRITVSSWFNGIQPDIIIKTEELNDKFGILNDLFKCSEPLPWVNTSEHKPYREYYNHTTRQWVAEMFKDDLDLYGYDF